jgi:hypothetical protein
MIACFPFLRTTLFAAMTLAGGAAQALTIQYECTGHRVMTGEFTPRVAQLHFEGSNWTLTRVRDAHEARYVNGRAGVTVASKERAMTFTHGSETLACSLHSDALTPPVKPPVKTLPLAASAPVAH